MRPRAILLVATFTMFCDAPAQRLEADAHHPPHQFFVEGLVAPVDAGDTHCPVATKALYFCALSPPSHLSPLPKFILRLSDKSVE